MDRYEFMTLRLQKSASLGSNLFRVGKKALGYGKRFAGNMPAYGRSLTSGVARGAHDAFADFMGKETVGPNPGRLNRLAYLGGQIAAPAASTAATYQVIKDWMRNFGGNPKPATPANDSSEGESWGSNSAGNRKKAALSLEGAGEWMKDNPQLNRILDWAKQNPELAGALGGAAVGGLSGAFSDRPGAFGRRMLYGALGGAGVGHLTRSGVFNRLSEAPQDIYEFVQKRPLASGLAAGVIGTGIGGLYDKPWLGLPAGLAVGLGGYGARRLNEDGSHQFSFTR